MLYLKYLKTHFTTLPVGNPIIVSCGSTGIPSNSLTTVGETATDIGNESQADYILYIPCSDDNVAFDGFGG